MNTETAENGEQIQQQTEPSAESQARAVYDRLASELQERESAKDAALAKAKTEAASKTEQSSPTKNRGEDGKFVKQKPKSAPEPTLVRGQGDESESDDESEPEVDGTDAKAQERALTALRRAKVPKDIMEGLPEEVKLRWGRQLAKMQGETDRMAQEFAALKKGQSDKQPDAKTDNLKSDSQRATKQAQSEQPEQAYIRQAAKQLADTFMLGDEAEEAFAAALQNATKPLSERYAQMEQQVQVAAGLSTQMLLANSRSALTAEFPELRDKEGFGQVVQTMQRLAESGTYMDIEDLNERTQTAMRDAAQVVFREQVNARLKAQRETTDRKRNAGQSSTPKRNGSTEINGMSRDRAIFHLMSNEGLTGPEARRRIDGY